MPQPAKNGVMIVGLLLAPMFCVPVPILAPSATPRNGGASITDAALGEQV